MIFNKPESIEKAEAGLEDALKNFRSSVHAWSESEFLRPRPVLVARYRRTWRSAAAWALGCALAAGTLSVGIHEHHAHIRVIAQGSSGHFQAVPRQDAVPGQDLTRSIAQETAGTAGRTPASPKGTDEKLMAAVDHDVSQPVPSAMEPLAQLMDEGAGQ